MKILFVLPALLFSFVIDLTAQEKDYIEFLHVGAVDRPFYPIYIYSSNTTFNFKENVYGYAFQVGEEQYDKICGYITNYYKTNADTTDAPYDIACFYCFKTTIDFDGRKLVSFRIKSNRESLRFFKELDSVISNEYEGDELKKHLFIKIINELEHMKLD